MKIHAINQPKEIEHYKPLTKWHFGEFSKSGTLKAEDLWRDIADRARQMFVVEDPDIQLVLLTQIFPGDEARCVVTHAAGKNRHAWQKMWPMLEIWAQKMGCKHIEAVARPGWRRILEGFGLKMTHVVLERKI